MRGSVRQFVPLLLAATYAVLWTCGSGWHLANCTHCDHTCAGYAAAGNNSTEKGSHCCRTHSGTKNGSHSQRRCLDRPIEADAASSSEKNRSPELPHDASNCEVCQLFAQALTFVSLSSVEVSPELVETSVCLIPLTVPECELILATSRGPPTV